MFERILCMWGVGAAKLNAELDVSAVHLPGLLWRVGMATNLRVTGNRPVTTMEDDDDDDGAFV